MVTITEGQVVAY